MSIKEDIEKFDLVSPESIGDPMNYVGSHLDQIEAFVNRARQMRVDYEDWADDKNKSAGQRFRRAALNDVMKAGVEIRARVNEVKRVAKFLRDDIYAEMKRDYEARKKAKEKETVAAAD